MSKQKEVKLIFDLPNNIYAEKIKTKHNIDLGFLFSLRQRIINDKIDRENVKTYVQGYITANSLYKLTQSKLTELVEDIYQYLLKEKTWEQ